MSRRGCFSSIVLLLILVIVALVALLVWMGSEPNGIRTRIAADRTMLSVGETMALSVTIENVSLDAVQINSVGLEEDLLEGLTLVQTLVGGDPQSLPVDERDFPVIGAWTEYSLDREIAPGDTLDVTFVLEAAQPGSYLGEVTTWVDSRPLGLPLVQARRETLDYAVQ
ncbi:MAG: TRAPPC13 family protein [Chloroflexi bacterium]|nr:TRAPPC13 family protein [Chloroflexota bacterium]